METRKNPGFNFPVSGLAAIILTGMFFAVNYKLSKVYLPVIIKDRPQPVYIEIKKSPETFETEETENLAREPLAVPNRNTPLRRINQPATILPIPNQVVRGPGNTEIHNIKSDPVFKMPNIRDYFTPDQVEQTPRILRAVTPIYPYRATSDGIEGRVVIRFIVDENGGVQNPVVVKAEPEGVFEEAALTAIVKYKFIPARIGNKNVKCIVVLPIGFRLK